MTDHNRLLDSLDLIPIKDSFRRYTTATGGVNDRTTGLLRLTQAQFANLQSLFFTVNGVTFELTANAQIWPVSILFFSSMEANISHSCYSSVH